MTPTTKIGFLRLVIIHLVRNYVSVRPHHHYCESSASLVVSCGTTQMNQSRWWPFNVPLRLSPLPLHFTFHCSSVPFDTLATHLRLELEPYIFFSITT